MKLYVFMSLLIASSSARLCPFLKQPTVREGYKLTGHVITSYPLLGCKEACVEACSTNTCCHSINLYRKRRECELNEGNHVTQAKAMEKDPESVYVEVTVHSECNSALGMEDKRILDSQITAPSAYDNRMHGYYARLNNIGQAWATKFGNLNQWLQVDLLKATHVCGIATQGFDSINQFVKTYSLQYSDDGVVLTDYKAGHVFQGNKNNKGIVKNDLIPDMVGRYIRVLPRSWYEWISMRIELYGC